MCGIAGLIVFDSDFGITSVLKNMSNALVHRGPDDEGFYETVSSCGKYNIGLAHRRLSIIDLSTGHQPLGNHDNSIQIVFNGEIYNFKELRSDLVNKGYIFKTSSDTEVIIYAYEEYGYKCVELLRGMFAFAIWDDVKQRLFVARDRFGKKPLFFYKYKNIFAFASEIKSILKLPNFDKKIDTSGIWNYFSYRYVPGPNTLFENIKKLPPGTYAVWHQGNFTSQCYYTPPDCCPKPVNNNFEKLNNIEDEFLKQLDNAVQIRMISDVPFGAFLSGGIDSSAIVALMSKHSAQPIKTFSIGFAESKYSELSYAKSVAEKFNTDHHELIVSENDLMDELPKLIHFRDAPIAEPSDIPIYLLSKEASKSVKMVLTGEGSDELLGGYPKHLFECFVPYYHLIPRLARNNFIEPTINALPYRFRRWKTAIQAMAITDHDERMARWFGALTMDDRENLLSLQHNSPPLHSPRNNNSLRDILCFDQTSWLPDNLLERGDRMTMAASIEARMPFMDHVLYEFVNSKPNKIRINGRSTKWILRKCMQQILPKVILNRPKVGFRVPVNEWFQGSMREYLHDHLTGQASITNHYYKKNYLAKVLKEHYLGRHNHEKLLWALLNLEIWHRECA